MSGDLCCPDFTDQMRNGLTQKQMFPTETNILKENEQAVALLSDCFFNVWWPIIDIILFSVVIRARKFCCLSWGTENAMITWLDTG